MGRQLDIPTETKFFANVETLHIGPEVKEILPETFAGAERLKTVDISEGVEVIGHGAFVSCRSLEEVTLPSTLKVVESSLFENCEVLSKVVLPVGITAIRDGSFAFCPSLKEIDLPSSLVAIGEIAFIGSGLEAVAIPESVSEIGFAAFRDCPLSSVRVFWDTPLAGDEGSPSWFSNYDNAKLIVPRASIDAYKETLPWSWFENIVSEPWIKCTSGELVFTVGERKTLSFEVMDSPESVTWNIFCEPESSDIFTIDPDTMELVAVSEGSALLHVAATTAYDIISDVFTVTVKADSAVEEIVIGADEIVTVYNTSGVKVAEGIYSDLSGSLSGGLYIIRTASGKTRKLLIR